MSASPEDVAEKRIEVPESFVHKILDERNEARALVARMTAGVNAASIGLEELERLTTLRSCDDYHEDYGSVLFWKVPIEEPPYVGTMLDDDFPKDYYTHWSPLPTVRERTP